MKKSKIFVLMLIAVFINNSTVYAWNALSHYHINNQNAFVQQPVFDIGGTGPDMSIQILGDYLNINDENNIEQSWADYFHSPDLKVEDNERPYAKTPNFAYLMLKVSENNGAANDFQLAQAMGWGGHIAADWVAHNDNLFPICPDGSLGSVKHFLGETQCELYSYLTKGEAFSPFDLTATFDVGQIHKALLNYRLISIHENRLEKQEKTDEGKLKETALLTTLPASCIEERIDRWVAKLVIVQCAYRCATMIWNPFQTADFINKMELRGVASNLALSEMSAYAWATNPTPRGNIPDYGEQIVPFYKQKLMGASNTVLAQYRSAGYGIENTEVEASAVEPFEAARMSVATYDAASISTQTVEAEDDAFWQEIIDKSLNDASVRVESTITAEGMQQVRVNVQDIENLWAIIQETAFEKASEGGGQSYVADFWKKLLVEGIADPEILTDIMCPVISPMSPAENSFINISIPRVTAQVYDDDVNSNIDRTDVYASIDGDPAVCSLTGMILECPLQEKLSEGSHTVFFSVTDKAGNNSTKNWRFTVDTIAPKLCYKIRNGTISASKSVAEIIVIPDEPSMFSLTIFRVASNGKIAGIVMGEKHLGQTAAIRWNGTDDSGSKVANGQYMMRVQATDRAGNIKTMDRSIKVRW